jgi:hypothetical protein
MGYKRKGNGNASNDQIAHYYLKISEMKIVFGLFLLSSMSLKSQQLINADFELWGDSSKKYIPINWSPDLVAALWNSPSTNAQHGKYAVVLTTWYGSVYR